MIARPGTPAVCRLFAVMLWSMNGCSLHHSSQTAIHRPAPSMNRPMLSRDSLSSLKAEVSGESSGHRTRRHIMAKQHTHPIKPPSGRDSRQSRHDYIIEWSRLRALQGATQLLQRIEAVRVKHSIRRHVHRYYAMGVCLQSHHSLFGLCDADYVVEHAHGELMSFRDGIVKYAGANTKTCEKCKSCCEYLDQHSEHTHRVLSSWRDREQRIESLILALIRLLVGPDQAIRLGACEGCDSSILALARFLRQRYQPSTGIL